MSRQNKVNPGRYTQRGRLTQDDAARELRKQSATGSPHTWQPVNTKTRRRLAPAGDAEMSADNETMVETSPRVEARPASRVRTNVTAIKAAPSTAKAKAATPKTVRTRKSKRTTGNAKTGKAMTTAIKRATSKPTQRRAVLARNVGGGGAAPRPTTKRRKT